MDWVVKPSSWDLAELDGENNHCIALTGLNSLGDGKNKGFRNDLRLARSGEMRDGTRDKLEERKGSAMLPSPSGLSKKIHALNGTQNMSCLVDGCTSDLSKCREYHRRHRVCERHSKTPVVIIGGREQRFCQQCSRFHSLGEFDEVKRSCRKRLDGHNRRRRKPQPESLYMSSHSFLSDYKGARLLQFSGPQAYATTTGGISISWPSIDEDNQQFHSSLKKAFSGINKQFPFLLASNPEKGIQGNPQVSISQKLVNTNGSSESNCGHLLLSNKWTRLEESKRALSLLSTRQTQTREKSTSPLKQQDTIHLNHPTGTTSL